MPTSRPHPSGGRPPTVKEQRAAARAEKLEAFRREQARAKRNRRIWTVVGVTAAVAVVALVVVSVVVPGLAGARATYSAGGTGEQIEGVETFENTSLHTTESVDYPQTPPAGGSHNPAWLNCGVYSQPVPNENAVHSLEHGAVWVTYDPALPDDEVQRLRQLVPSTYAILSPFEGLPSPVVLSGWNTQLAVDSVDDERIGQFLEEYWQSADVPEPGASCTGAIDAPGKES